MEENLHVIIHKAFLGRKQNTKHFEKLINDSLSKKSVALLKTLLGF